MRRIFVLFFTFLSTIVICQLRDDFTDGDLASKPKWSGDVSNFTVVDGAMRLQASTIPRSFIYTDIIVPDSFVFSMNLSLEFSPSSSNLTRVYFFLDDIDLTKANGYYLNFGENNNTDAIRLYRLNRGASTLLGSAKTGAIANASNDINFILTYKSGNKWTFNAAYDKTSIPSREFELEEVWQGSKKGFFGIECIYTSTRTDKFSYDNIALDLLIPDKVPPVLTTVQEQSPRQIHVTFNEEVSLPSISQFILSPNAQIESITYDGLAKNKLKINLSTSLIEGTSYALTMNGVSDLVGNVATPIVINKIGIFPSPSSKELLLTEVLFDPVSGGEDYIEIANVSNKIINLDSMSIRNQSKNETTIFLGKYLMPPGAIYGLSSNVKQVSDQYKPIKESVLITQNLPSLNNESGNVTILNKMGLIVDSFYYKEEMHNSLLKNTEGVSLERVIDENGSYTQVWSSSSSTVNYGTPGYKNSALSTSTLAINDFFSLIDPVFSPDGDGLRDELILSYNFPQSGYSMSLAVYSAEGHKLVDLANNIFVNIQGNIKWDGTNKDGTRERAGVYYLNGVVYNPDGEVFNIHKSCILALKF